MTIVKGRVVESKSSELEKTYDALKTGADLPPGLQMSLLARDATDPESYFILTVWESRDALERMRSSGQVPAAVAAFKNLGVEPQISISEIRKRLP